MLRIDKLHLEYPFAAAGILRDMLWQEDMHVDRRHLGTLIKDMGIEVLYRKPETSKPGEGHQIYPYLLCGIRIDQLNHVWAIDVTYIPIARGFVYLAAVVDWATRRVLSWRLSITMTTVFCLEELDEALRLYGWPQIFNTDKGSQFTSYAFTEALRRNGIAISMDGKRSWRANVFVERLW